MFDNHQVVIRSLRAYLAQGSKLRISFQDHQGIAILRSPRASKWHLTMTWPGGHGSTMVLWLKNDCDQCLRVLIQRLICMNIPCLLYVSQSSIIRFGELIVELIILSHGNTIPFWVQKPGTLMQKCPRNWTMECQHRLQNSNHYLKFDDLNLQECPVLHFWAMTMWGFPTMGNKPHWFACQKPSITNRW